MSKISNYNYAFVFYDVNEKRVNKVFKVCKKYLSHFQKSVFRGEMSPSKLIRFKKDINSVIDKTEDFICIIKLMNDNVFGEEILGGTSNATGEDLIIWPRIKSLKNTIFLPGSYPNEIISKLDEYKDWAMLNKVYLIF